MKIIYMEETVLLLSEKYPNFTPILIQKGEIKKHPQTNKPYLVIVEDNERKTK